jgi:hypothetical protein
MLDNENEINAFIKNETIWLTQKSMSELFDVLSMAVVALVWFCAGMGLFTSTTQDKSEYDDFRVSLRAMFQSECLFLPLLGVLALRCL